MSNHTLLFIILEIGAFAAAFAAGYYVSHRGWTGVKADLEDVKEDVVKIKNKVAKK